MRALVCGGRDFANDVRPGYQGPQHTFVIATLDRILHPIVTDDMATWLPPDGTFIIAGAARGVDKAAIDWAVVNWVPFQEYPADWEKYGKRAGYVRNKQMLEEGKPDLVIAFPGGKGTAMMVKIAREAGVPVEEVKYEE
jgi:hypothetical protein